MLYPLASQQIAIDLDDGVKANYPKFGAALKKIPALRQAMSEAATVRPHLERWFESRRVVFWHDPDGQYAADLDGLDLPGVADDPCRQRRVRHQEPAAARRAGRASSSSTAQAVPTGIGNWLLDLELAYGVFTADRTSLVAQDLGLTAEGIDEVVRRTRSSSTRQARPEPQGAAEPRG